MIRIKSRTHLLWSFVLSAFLLPAQEPSSPSQQAGPASSAAGEKDGSLWKTLQFRDQLNKGAQAFRKAKYEEATEHFQKSVDLDPSSTLARLYLGTAYAEMVVPDDLSTKNIQIAQSAIDAFQIVLQKNPTDSNALKQIASVYYNLQKLDTAKDYQSRVLAQNPNDAEAEYTIGVIDWLQSYHNAVGILAGINLKDDGEGNIAKDSTTCLKLQAVNLLLVKDGITHLTHAIDLQSNYSDAMAYLNLTYRRKADLECNDDPGRKADIDQAYQWRERSISSRRKAGPEESAKP